MLSQNDLSKIYDSYVDKIYRFVLVKVDSRETAQDITAETFTRFFEYFRRSQQQVDNVQAFLYRTARNLVTDFYRQKSRTDTSLDDGFGQDDQSKFRPYVILANDEHIESAAAKSEESQTIVAALQNMGGEQADVVAWHYIDELSIREIAEILNKPEGTVRVLLHRGLKRLRNILASRSS